MQKLHEFQMKMMKKQFEEQTTMHRFRMHNEQEVYENYIIYIAYNDNIVITIIKFQFTIN